MAFSLRLLLYSSHLRSLADFPSARGLLNSERSGVDADLFRAEDDDDDDFFLCDFFIFSLFFFLEREIHIT